MGNDKDLADVLTQEYKLPIKRRRDGVLGGFPRNTDREVIINKLAEHKKGVQFSICPGDYNSKGKWLFSSNAASWSLMKAMSGKKFEVGIGG